MIHKFIEVEASSQKTQKERKIDILLSNLHEGDSLLVSELSRLGRNMLEVLNNLSSTLNKWITKGYKGVKISI